MALGFCEERDVGSGTRLLEANGRAALTLRNRFNTAASKGPLPRRGGKNVHMLTSAQTQTHTHTVMMNQT